MNDTLFGDGWRWAVVVVFAVAAAMPLLGLVWKFRNAKRGRGPLISFQESMGHVGATLVCALVSWGMLGYLLGWDSALRLPALVFGAAFSIVGRGAEWLGEVKRGKD